MTWGATLAAGAQARRLFGASPQAETRAIHAGERIVKSFIAQNKYVNCVDITDIDNTASTMKMVTYFLIKGGSIGCFRMSARYAPVAFREINTALSEQLGEPPSAPVSCSALLARKMGASNAHAVMAAGLAGGIGLSANACGALATAIWILGMNSLGEGGRRLDFKSPRALDTIERFLKLTDYEFDCSKIVGRTFKDVDDHASHLHNGGCAQIIDAIASP
jgi:hypothetical protein